MDESKSKGMTKLSDGALDAVAGGYILDLGADYYDPSSRWCLVDEVGTPIHFTYSSSELEEITKYADQRFYSSERITKDDYVRMFGEGFW